MVGPDLLRPRRCLRPRRRLGEVDGRRPPDDDRGARTGAGRLHAETPRAAGGRRPKISWPRAGGEAFVLDARDEGQYTGAVARGEGQGGARAWGRPSPLRQTLRPRERHLPLRRGAGAQAGGGWCARGQRRAGRRLLQRRGRCHGPALRVAPARVQEAGQLRRLVERVGVEGGSARRALSVEAGGNGVASMLQSPRS